MAVNLTEKRADELLEIDGIRLFTGRAGIKQQNRDDLTLMVLGGGHTVGAVFTPVSYTHLTLPTILRV